MSIHSRLSLMQFFQFLIWGSWFVTAGTFMIMSLGFSGTQVGLIYANNAIAASLSPLLVGIVADKYFSVEKLLSILHFMGAILLFTMSRVQTFELFFIVNLLYVLTFMPTFSLSNSMTFHHVTDAKKEYPKIRVWGTIAWIIAGLMISGFALENSSLTFIIASGLAVLQGLYCLTLPDTRPTQNTTTFLKDITSPEMVVLWKDRGFQAIIVSLALISIPAAYYYSFVNPFLNEMNISNAAGKMTLGQIVEIIFMLALPWFIAKWNLKHLIALGLFLWGARYGLFAIGEYTGNPELWYIVGILVHGVAYIFGMLTAQIYLDIKVPDHLRSTAQGFFSFLTMGVMAWIGTYIAGETVSFYTFADGSHDWYQIWLIPMFCGILTTVIFLLMFKK